MVVPVLAADRVLIEGREVVDHRELLVGEEVVLAGEAFPEPRTRGEVLRIAVGRPDVGVPRHEHRALVVAVNGRLLAEPVEQRVRILDRIRIAREEQPKLLVQCGGKRVRHRFLLVPSVRLA